MSRRAKSRYAPNLACAVDTRSSSAVSLSLMSMSAPAGSEASVRGKRSRCKPLPARPIYDEPPFDRDSAIPF